MYIVEIEVGRYGMKKINPAKQPKVTARDDNPHTKVPPPSEAREFVTAFPCSVFEPMFNAIREMRR